jgi:hypothetical protein
VASGLVEGEMLGVETEVGAKPEISSIRLWKERKKKGGKKVAILF